jgi:hypothetical protein
MHYDDKTFPHQPVHKIHYQHFGEGVLQCVSAMCHDTDILQSNMHILHQETHYCFCGSFLNARFTRPRYVLLHAYVRLLHQKGCYNLLEALQQESWLEV